MGSSRDDLTRSAASDALASLVERIKWTGISGSPALYIPELGQVDAMQCAMSVCSIDGENVSAGDQSARFTMQGISKSMALLYVLEGLGQKRVFSRVGQINTGGRFDQIEFLTAESSDLTIQEIPTNPLINAGALAVTALFPGKSVEDKFEGYLQYVRRLCSNGDLQSDEATCESEYARSFNNRAIAWVLLDKGALEAPSVDQSDYVGSLIRLYCLQCSVKVSCEDLAQFAAVAANHGRDLDTGAILAQMDNVRVVLAIAQTCGLYGATGSFHVQAGIPAIAGVSGGFVGIVPNKLGVVSYNPCIDTHGVSTFGQQALIAFSQERDLGAYTLDAQAREKQEVADSCFISFSHADADFATYLSERLNAEGVRTWFAPDSMQSGRKIKDQIDSAIKTYDRLLLVLSQESMHSPWVISEVLEARKREKAERRRILFPIRLVAFKTIADWECSDSDSGSDIAREVREYFIPDFTDWRHRRKFNRMLARLMLDLGDEN